VDEQHETVWTTQKAMAELFDVDRTVITKHLKNIFKESELLEEAVCAKIAHTAADGKKYMTTFYNLDAIISVGYRVNSQSATRFRIWATGVLRDYLVKGFVMDDERLKQGESLFNKDYFDELIDFSFRPLRLCVELINTILLSIKQLNPNRFFQRMFFYESNKSISWPPFTNSTFCLTSSKS
ncbi:MAG: virulence RhuM family protein, partial [Flavobacteriia bacterium]|nr:virulence RhuM family protein [Flavobacteriia bacterium]